MTRLGNGNTRMYVGVGNASDSGGNRARFYRTDDAVTATNASFTDMTTTQNLGYCTSQCWYDNVVYSPPGQTPCGLSRWFVLLRQLRLYDKRPRFRALGERRAEASPI